MQRAVVIIGPRFVEGDGDSCSSRRQLRISGPIRSLRLKEPGIQEDGWIVSGSKGTVSRGRAETCGYRGNKIRGLGTEGNSVGLGRIQIRPGDGLPLMHDNFAGVETHDGSVLQSSPG